MRTPRHPDTILVKNEYYPNGLKEIDTYNYYESIKDKLIVEVSGRDLIIFLAIDNRILVLRHGKTTRYVRLNRGNFDDVFHARMLSVHCSMHEVERFGIIDIDCNDFKRAKQATKDTYDFVTESVPFIESAFIKYTGKNSFHIVCAFKRDLYVDRAKILLRNYLEKGPLQQYTIDEVRRTPKASRMEPATTCSFTWSWVENATSMTKKLTSRPIRSAKVTNQPCPPPWPASLRRAIP